MKTQATIHIQAANAPATRNLLRAVLNELLDPRRMPGEGAIHLANSSGELAISWATDPLDVTKMPATVLNRTLAPNAWSHIGAEP
jgi:hypothetical protein